MVDTFKMMNQIRLNKFANISEQQLVLDYGADNSVIAEIYCRNFKMWLSLANKPRFAYIDKSDKVSYVLQGIYEAICGFNPCKNVTFMTFAHKCVYNALVGALIKANSYGGWQRKNDVSIEAFLLNEDAGINNEQQLNLVCEDCADFVDFMQLINSDVFTERERIMCKAIIADPHITDIELSEIIKMHRHTVRTTKLNIRKKFVTIYNSL